MSKRMRLRDLRSRLCEMMDDGHLEGVWCDHAPGGLYGRCTFTSEWTFKLRQGGSTVDIVRWSGGEYSSETGFIDSQGGVPTS